MQNINIVYKVDKSEVDRSNAAVERARTITDQLKNSARQLGEQGAKANKAYQGSIEAVRVRMAQLRQQIDLTSRSDTARMNTLIKQYQQARKEVEDFNRKVNEGSKQQTAGINNVAGAFSNMYSAIRLVVSAGIVRELVDTALSAATLAGQVEAVGNAFRRQIPDSEAILLRLRRATRGTVGDLELMQRALKFQNFGGDVEALPRLLEFAAVRAQQTGESVDYLVNSIVNGIGRKSLLIIDNLGISAARLKEELGGVSAQASSVAEFSAAVSRIAGQELEKMGGFAANSATSVDQLKVSFQDLRIELSKKFEGGWLADFLNQSVSGLRDLVKNFSFDPIQLFKNLGRDALQQEALKNVTEELDRIKQRTIGTDQEKLDMIQQEINSRVQLIGRYNDNIKAIQQEQQEIRKTNPYSEKIDKLQQLLVGYQTARYEVQLMITKLAEYYKTLRDGSGAEANQIKTLKDLRDELEALQKKREEDTDIRDTAELDRLQREILILEDRILKISDNIAWERQWLSATKASEKGWEEFTEQLRDASKAIDELTKKYSPEDIKVDKFDFGELEVEAEVQPTFKLDNEKWVRFRLELKQWFTDNWKDITAEGIDFTSGLLQNIYNQELDHYAARIQNVQNYYAQLQDLAGGNDRFRKELQIKEQRETAKLQRELAIKQKQARIFSIIVDTAAAIAKAWVNPGYPAAIPLSIFLAAQGAAQAAVVNRAPMGFKDGVIDLKGPGTSTSDSIPANLSRGESVMTAKETQTSKNTLRMIRAKQLDDNVVARLAARAKGGDSSGFDDSRLAKIMEQVAKNTRNSDIIRKGSTIYEAKKESDTLTKYIRSKNIN